jgi:glycerate 2-kinase
MSGICAGRRPRLAGRPDIIGLAADTDGLDGTSGAAGAFFGGARRIRPARRRWRRTTAPGSVAGLFVTGPTGTNVSDLRIILVAP